MCENSHHRKTSTLTPTPTRRPRSHHSYTLICEEPDIDDGNRPGRTREESTELREARKQIRLLQQENEVLRRAAAYLSQANLPGKGTTRS